MEELEVGTNEKNLTPRSWNSQAKVRATREPRPSRALEGAT